MMIPSTSSVESFESRPRFFLRQYITSAQRIANLAPRNAKLGGNLSLAHANFMVSMNLIKLIKLFIVYSISDSPVYFDLWIVVWFLVLVMELKSEMNSSANKTKIEWRHSIFC